MNVWKSSDDKYILLCRVVMWMCLFHLLYTWVSITIMRCYESKIMLAAFQERAWTISYTVVEDGALSPDILVSWQRDLSSCCVMCAYEMMRAFHGEILCLICRLIQIVQSIGCNGTTVHWHNETGERALRFRLIRQSLPRWKMHRDYIHELRY